MIDQVQGEVVRLVPHAAYIRMGGWVLEVRVSLFTAQTLRAGAQVSLYTVLMLPREEGVPVLYGFGMVEERQYFLALLRVPRVGPQVALAILSQYPPAVLAEHIRRGDARALSRVRGVGSKLAQQILLELGGRLPQEEPQGAAYAEARVALLHLGFSSGEAEERLRKVFQAHPTASSEEMVRLALMQNP